MLQILTNVYDHKHPLCAVNNHYTYSDCSQICHQNHGSLTTCIKIECRANLNFEVDFAADDAIETIVTKWGHILFRKWIVFIRNIFFLTTNDIPLT